MDIFTTCNWNCFLDEFPAGRKDIYFTEEYAKIHENEENTAECFVCRDGNRLFLFPYLKRKVSLLDGKYYDFETPYGYSGPLSNTDDAAFNIHASHCFFDISRQSNFIAGFIRFHPLLSNQYIVSDHWGTCFDRKTIAINLNLSKDEIWLTQVHRKHRTSIRKAENHGLRFEADIDLKNYDKFIRMYTALMNSLQSDEFYYFDNNYFELLRSRLGGNSFLGLVYHEDKIIACIIFFIYGIYGHAHLGGGLIEYFDFCPNNFLFYNAALYLKDRGVKLFHFGGGTSGSEEDQLFKFKKRFSKLQYDYYVGKMLINDQLYFEACNLWDKQSGDRDSKYSNYFLKYRY